MKPIRLAMTAFGPYKDTQVIDFRDIEPYQLFAISGKTGAGKTTIFDGICYALYGEANGEDRKDAKLLRSHFADDQIHTAVELIFALQGKTYKIFRQMPHTKNGNKNPSGQKIEFYEQTGGLEVPCVDRFHVTDVNQKVIDLIGLSKDQFTQIVMLPQGEFRKLLTSDTVNKEEILRRIFKTESFQWMRQLLDERRKEAQTKLEQLQIKLDTLMQTIATALPERSNSLLSQILSQANKNAYQILAGLQGELQEYEDRIKEWEQKKDQTFRSYKEKEAEYHRAKAYNDRFVELDAKQQQKSALEQKLPEHRSREKQLQLAEKAARIEPYEEHMLASRSLVQEKRRQWDQCSRLLQEAVETLTHAEVQAAIETKKQQQREQVSRDIQTYEELQPKLAELHNKRQSIQKLAEQEQKSQSGLQQREDRIKQWNQERILIANELSDLEQQAVQLPKLSRQHMELEAKHQAVVEYLKLQQEYRRYQKEELTARQAYEQALEQYQIFENQWIQGQAGILAEHLQDGAPCPVCGSLDHPLKAEMSANVPSKSMLDKKRNEREQQTARYNELKSQCTAAQLAQEQKADMLSNFQIPAEHASEYVNALAEQLQEMNTQVKHLEIQTAEIETKRQAEREWQAKLQQLETERAALQRQVHEIQLQRVQEKAKYDSIKETLPVDISSLSDLQGKLKHIRALQKQLEQQWQLAEEQLRNARESEIAMRANLQHAERQRQEACQANEAATQRYRLELANAGFETEESYQSAKLAPVMREALKEEIDTFTSTLLLLTQRVYEMQKELSGKPRTNVEELLQNLKQLETQYNTLVSEYETDRVHYKDATMLKERIERTCQDISEQEKASQVITGLYDVVRGENEQKLSFERYLQIEFLELIIQAANIRLKKLTHGQFYLERSEKLAGQGRQSGLGLDVFDSYTGQKRDVKSLSGGEKFKASLSLALGLTDIIQSYKGGISIDTMWIDEGFGSLDEESLHEAIEALAELQKAGRMIGVISHVQELKQAFPAVLEVEKTNDGHSQARFVIR
ncbi:SMC family ATPase [Fodinisporobacter ferrooxydans]|uniref:Nuclease SbcCD subunit C n=1 Tax=Fodinisporobacter ferrooxydans TaxID=2901836 RepID=A0ABY4CJY7_9BACL|nr:SMC family ATPase [Alicyclobacillaceae bacterium MYW30-H2]